MPLHVVLVSTRNPLNIGAAARAMSNFGFSSLRVVNPFEPSFREAKSAVGASHILQAAEQFTSLADAVGDCSLVIGTTTGRDRDLSHPTRLLDDAATEIRRRSGSANVALLFGSEKRGLSNDDLAHCHWLLRIPTREERPSMNLGQAVATCLYEIGRGTPSRVAAMHDEERATSADLERLTHLLVDALRASDYIKARSEVATEDNVRRLIRRLHLTGADAELLLGMLRKIARKLQP
jgi:tRNA/rRNA methyltransferase